MNRDLILIKRHYGEKMMRLCRSLFPELLEHKGLLYELLTESFYPSRYLYSDIVNNHAENKFRDYIFSKTSYKRKISEEEKTHKTPYELLRSVGYTLYECKTEEDIQSFRHFYYRGKGAEPLKKYVPGTVPARYTGEELCTFNGGRLDRCYVFFAVKDGAEKLDRSKFIIPDRQDEYGTSVMSIQFSRFGPINWLSIKNRYNHGVKNKNPDATFNNNLDNIVLGLTNAFEETYNLSLDDPEEVDFELPGYVKARNGKHYKYKIERWGHYYCYENVVIDSWGVHEYDKAQYIMCENCVIDLKSKKIVSVLYDSFYKTIGDIESVSVQKDRKTSEKTVTINGDIIIKLDKEANIIEYTNPHVTEIPDEFLQGNTTLRRLSLPNAISYGTAVLMDNTSLTELDSPKTIKTGHSFLFSNRELRELYMPKLRYVGRGFLYKNSKLEDIYLPNIMAVQSGFLECNKLARENFYKRIKDQDYYNLSKYVRKYMKKKYGDEKQKVLVYTPKAS